MIYEIAVTYTETSGHYTLRFTPETQFVTIPPDDHKDFFKVKELCAGIGGIGQGLRFAGFDTIAAVDVNPYMCETLRRGGQTGVLCGDILDPRLRGALHCTPSPVRCTYASGFPCQPLSTQGDQRGVQDARSKPFQGVMAASWEHQIAALILENVPMAAHTDYVQSGIQKLAWSLGFDIYQTQLNLDNSWPCRRSRWWSLLIPHQYNIHSIPDLPWDRTLRLVGQLLPHWPTWTPQEEAALLVSDEDLAKLQDPEYGSDDRWLRDDKPCPCILHAYSNFAVPCPCGCRAHPLGEQRLRRDGIRGFFVLSKVYQRPRWLHPREAALLCALDPFGAFSPDPRGALAQIGQCASPLQASWMGAHLLKSVLPEAPAPEMIHHLHKMALLRQGHGLTPLFPHQDQTSVDVVEDGMVRTLLVHANTTVADLQEAERRLRGMDTRITVLDNFGILPKDYRLAGGAVQGPLQRMLAKRPFKTTLAYEHFTVTILEATSGQTATGQAHGHDFLFEVLNRMGISLESTQHLVDVQGNIWRGDQRILQDTVLVLVPLHGGGPRQGRGLNDATIDHAAKQLLDLCPSEAHAWLDPMTLTMNFHDPGRMEAQGWSDVLQLGTLWGALVTEGHWILLRICVKQATLHVEAWDGLPPTYEAKLTTFAYYLQHQLGLHHNAIQCKHVFRQQHASTCGTIALLHMGYLLELWTLHTAPDEGRWHDFLLSRAQSGRFAADGPIIPLPDDAGLSHQVIDVVARRMLHISQFSETSFWMPSELMTWLLNDSSQRHLWHWLTGALYGTVRGCAAIDDHWLYISFTVEGQILKLQCWDGLAHDSHLDILRFAHFIQLTLAVRTVSVTYHSIYDQAFGTTCGTVALLHLGYDIGLWTPESAPNELLWHFQLLARFHHVGLCARGRTEDGEAGDTTLLWTLRDLLQQLGVPAERAEERAMAALGKIGKTKVQAALDSKHPWSHLKALGSQPKVNFLFVKPDELQQQIRLRAQSKFKAATAHRKQSSKGPPMPVVIDPAQLKLLPGTFQHEDGSAVVQLRMDEVAAERTGLAFATLSEIGPYLKQDQPISTGALAVLTVEPVPHSAQGLLTVENVRFPALYIPTAEPVLVDGSIVQLGDDSVVRTPNEKAAEVTKLDTVTFKLTVWKDQWPGAWDQFLKAPVRAILERTPRLVLCRGDRCGRDCPKYHTAVDASDIDAVIQDLWNRSWLSQRGRRTTAEEADQFQVTLRIPVQCADGLQQRSGQDGIYYERRSDDGRKPDESTAIIWIPGTQFQDAMHQVKTHDRSICLVRWNGRYGIRTRTSDAEALHTALDVDSQYSEVSITAVYEARPLPHGIQKAGVAALIKQWGWAARPLQPCRGDHHGRAWLIGAEQPPPSSILPTTDGDVMLSLHRKPVSERPPLTILGSQKTKTYLKKDQPASSGSRPSDPWKPRASAAAGKENVVPWEGKDPWGGYNPITDKTMEVDEQASRPSKFQQLQDTVQDQIKGAHEQRFQKLETDITEIRKQQDKFESWFQDAGQATHNLQNQVGTLTTQLAETKTEINHQVGALVQQVSDNRQGLTDMGNRIEQGFAGLQELLLNRDPTVPKLRRTGEKPE
eukprot:Skav232716  [mRNA]  locus=scaffold4051:84716:89491:+ [translate_table: standard]